MRSKTLITAVLLLVFSCVYFSGNAQKKNVLLGFGHTGIGLGYFEKLNGIDLSLWNFIQKDQLIAQPAGNGINGLSLSFYTSNKRSNGVNIGLFCANDVHLNGFKFSILDAYTVRSNGISIGGFFTDGDTLNGAYLAGIALTSHKKLNGFGFAPLIFGEQMNGLIIAPIGFVPGGGKLNGVGISGYMGRLQRLNGFLVGLRTIVQVQHGVSVGVVNVSADLRGIQLGLWNVAKNKKHLKKLPFINFCFQSHSRITEEVEAL